MRLQKFLEGIVFRKQRLNKFALSLNILRTLSSEYMIFQARAYFTEWRNMSRMLLGRWSSWR